MKRYTLNDDGAIGPLRMRDLNWYVIAVALGCLAVDVAIVWAVLS